MFHYLTKNIFCVVPSATKLNYPFNEGVMYNNTKEILVKVCVLDYSELLSFSSLSHQRWCRRHYFIKYFLNDFSWEDHSKAAMVMFVTNTCVSSSSNFSNLSIILQYE